VPAGRRLLIVEPLRALRDTKVHLLERAGFEVTALGSLGAALTHLDRHGAELVLLDVPDGERMWVPLEAVLSRHPTVPAVVMQSRPGIENAVEAMKRGAADYLAKSLDPVALLRSVHQALVARAPTPTKPRAGLLERSPAMRSLMEQVRRIVSSPSTVLLSGESGVGKEVIARFIHELSPRAPKDFVAINCASLSDDILENELFGHEPGAFTSANARKLGVFDLAHGGTLFLDEVSEMGHTCQAKLLRALECKEFRRVGGTAKVQVDVRIVAATNADLDEAVAARRFRRDLYYRLNVINLRIPPLRERRSVIPDMVRYFLLEFSGMARRRLRGVTPEAMARLVAYDWPGNVRELRNLVESLVVTTPGPWIERKHLPASIRAVAPQRELTVPIGLSMTDIEREVLRAYLEAYGTKKAAAEALRVALRTFHAKAKRYELMGPRGRRAPTPPAAPGRPKSAPG
jgi:DNA-binding NtrC family response regulator